MLTRFAVAIACTLGLTTVLAAPASATTGTSVTPAVVHLSGYGFDTSSAPATAILRAWTAPASPYGAVNIYFSGSQRYDKTQAELSADWVTTVLSNGWSLIPTVVDLQAPCAGTTSKKKMSSNATTAATQGANAGRQADADLQALGLAHTVAYLDLEPFEVSSSPTCAPAVLAFLHAFVKAMHDAGDKAGVYVHHSRGGPTIVADYNSTYRPDDIWVAETGSATAATSVIGSKWPHHRIHQYLLDSTEKYAGETLPVDRDAIDADVVRATSVTLPSGPAYAYNAIGIPSGSTLKHRAQPNTSAAFVTTSANGDQLDIQCQATGQAIDGDYVWDKLVDGTYVSDLYTTTTGRNWVSPAIAKCDTTPPTVTVTQLPLATSGATLNVRWSAADAADPDGNPNAEARGISSAVVRYRVATWHSGFGSWHSLPATTATSARIAMSPGNDYCVSVQVRDLSGNASSWSPQQCVARALDDRSMAASSAWSRRTGKNYFLHTYSLAASKGAVLARTKARVARVGVLATTCGSCGAVRVYVGTHFIGTVDMHASSTHYRRVLLLPPFSLRSGTVKLRTTSGKRVLIDGIVLSRT